MEFKIKPKYMLEHELHRSKSGQLFEDWVLYQRILFLFYVPIQSFKWDEQRAFKKLRALKRELQ